MWRTASCNVAGKRAVPPGVRQFKFFLYNGGGGGTPAMGIKPKGATWVGSPWSSPTPACNIGSSPDDTALAGHGTCHLDSSQQFEYWQQANSTYATVNVWGFRTHLF